MTIPPLSLRDHLLKSGLGIKSDYLDVAIENGSVTSVVGADNKHFITEYQIKLIVQSTCLNINAIIYIILQWLDQHYQNRSDTAFSYDVDILNHEAADIAFSIPIVETLRVSIDDNGGATITSQTCPPPEGVALLKSVTNFHQPS